MKQYTCLLFDLDHTLWDYDSNSEDTLEELFHRYSLQQRGISSFRFFAETFTRINVGMWNLHDRGMLNQADIREKRFHKVFYEAGLDDYPLSLKFSSDYLSELPKRSRLLPHAKEVLEYLYPRYPMIIVTNGFDEIQAAKLKSGGILHYFKTIVTSQRAGNKKPSREIFEFALSEGGHPNSGAVMIGDNLLTDMAGARSAGVDTIFFNQSGTPHNESVTFEIQTLDELRRLL